MDNKSVVKIAFRPLNSNLDSAYAAVEQTIKATITYTTETNTELKRPALNQLKHLNFVDLS